MKPRSSIILDTFTLGDSETKTIDINVNKPISAIQIYYTAKNGTTSCRNNWLWENISKVELVDGSEVLFSMKAPEAQGLAFYGHGIEARDYLTEVNSGTQACDIWMMFGRKLWDKLLALDPKKHTNPQLRLTHNIETIASVAVTAYQTDNTKVRVIAHLMEDIPAPIGFLQSKQLYSYDTGSSSTTKYLDLPTDFPYRLVMPRVYVDNKNGQEILQEIKLNIDHGAYIPFDLTGSDLADMGMRLRGLARECVRAHVIHNEVIDLTVMDSRRFGVSAVGSINDALNNISSAANRLTLVTWDVSDAAVTSTRQNVYIIARGVAKHGCMVYPFGDIDTIEDWLDVSGFGSVRIEPKTEGWSADASIIVQQYRRY